MGSHVRLRTLRAQAAFRGMRRARPFAAFGRLSSRTPFFKVAVSFSISISAGNSTMRRTWSEQLTAQIVLPFFASFLVSLLPLIVSCGPFAYAKRQDSSWPISICDYSRDALSCIKAKQAGLTPIDTN